MKYLQTKSVFEHYLKRFNESVDKSIDDIKQTIEDILFVCIIEYYSLYINWSQT